MHDSVEQLRLCWTPELTAAIRNANLLGSPSCEAGFKGKHH